MKSLKKSVNKSRKICAVPGCSSYSTKDTSLHNFPTDPKLCHQWKIAMSIGKPITKNMFVCSNHFLSEDFMPVRNRCSIRTRIRKGVVPSILPSPSIRLRPSNSDCPIGKSSRGRMGEEAQNEQNLEKINCDTCSLTNIENNDDTSAKNKEIPSRLSKLLDTLNADPLAISASDSLSFLGDNENIEFVIESDDDSIEIPAKNIGSKENPIVLHVTDLEKTGQVLAKDLSKFPVIAADNEVMDLDIHEIKDEIEIEEENVQTISSDESNTEIENQLNTQEEPGARKIMKENPLCYVPRCTVDVNEEDKLFWFKPPIDKNLRKIWDICIDRPDKRLSNDDIICHQHFSEKDMQSHSNDQNNTVSRVLNNGAVPCIKFHEKCCVPDCANTLGKMFNFPVLRTSNFDLWLYMIKNPELKKLKMREVLKYRVCAVHFEPDCFEPDFSLKSTAAPTQHLPGITMDALLSEDFNGNSGPQIDTVSCAFNHCTNTAHTGKMMFKFPQNPDRCMTWLSACKRDDLISTPDATVKRMMYGDLGVCGDHFEPHHFEIEGILKSDAVPIGDNCIDEPIRRSVSFSHNSIEAKETRYPVTFTGICSYKGCYNKATDENLFFSFPVDEARSEKWLKACGLAITSLSSRHQLLKNQKICHLHFEDYMFESKFKLKPFATPIPYRKSKEQMAAKRNIKEMRSSRSGTQEKIETVGNNSYGLKRSKIIYCAVSSCPNNYGLVHGKGKFPDPSVDKDRFDMWVKLVANPVLNRLCSERICSDYMVCLRHFHPKFYMKDGKVGNLNEEAIPTRHLTADITWLFTSDYYSNRLKDYLAANNFDLTNCKYVRQDILEYDKNEKFTTCVLEADGISFPNTGHYMFAEKKLNSKRKFPYDVYKFCKTGYGLNNDIMVGENIRIHTAIIIDDDDECERQVLQQLIDKKKRY